MTPESQRLLVLVLDDDPAIRAMLGALLPQEGFDVVEAETADQALGQLAQTPVDLVLSDVQLPGMDGIGFLDRASELRPDVPVILMTAYGEKQQLLDAIKLGAFDYIEKPFKLATLREALHRGSGRRRLQNARRVEVQERARVEALLGALAGAGCLDDLMERMRTALPAALEIRGFAVYQVEPEELGWIGGREDAEYRALATRSLLTCLPASKACCLAVPLLHGLEPIGVLVVERDRDRPFFPSDQRLLARAASHLAAAIAARAALEAEQNSGIRIARDEALEQAAEAARALSRPLASLASAVHEAEGHLQSDPALAKTRLQEARAAIDALRRELDALTKEDPRR